MMNDFGNFDHNSSPEIKILYHPNGNMREFNFIIPNPPTRLARECSENNLKHHSTRTRLDSGYKEQEENYLLANKSSLLKNTQRTNLLLTS
jgi:hypothetical protein